MLLKPRLLSHFPYRPFQPRPRDVRQGEVAECGLAALASLMSCHGAVVPMDQLRAMAASTLYGTSLRTLRDIAVRIGFDARAHRVEEIADLAKHVPCVVHLSFIHFAVVEKVMPGELLLSDPLAGAVRMPIDKFSRAFTGIALSLKPTRSLRRTEGAPLPSRRKLLASRGMGWACTAAAGSGGALAIAAISAGQGGVALALIALLAAVALTEIAIRSATRALASIAKAEQVISIEHVVAQPAAAFVTRSPHQSSALLATPPALMNPGLIDALLSASAMAALATGAMVASPMLGLAGIATLALEGACVAALTLWRGKPIPDPLWHPMPVRTPNAGELYRADGWGLGRGGEDLFRVMAGSHATAAEGIMPGAERGATLAGIRVGFAGARLAILLLAGTSLLNNGATAGALLACGALVMIAGSQIGRITAGLRTPGATAALHRLADRSETVWGDPPGNPPPGMALVLDNAAWRPAQMLPEVVRGVSLSIAAGASLAIIAPRRSGSTTIARLASGWLSPSSGSVRAGPTILIGTQWLHGAGRLRDLLSLDSNISDATLNEMLEAIGLADAITPRGGLDLKLSSGAPELSGGQRRRLMLAGALLRQPALLVLDGTLEALGTTSAASLLALCKARGTAVLIAGHRDDIAAHCDAAYRIER